MLREGSDHYSYKTKQKILSLVSHLWSVYCEVSKVKVRQWPFDCIWLLPTVLQRSPTPFVLAKAPLSASVLSVTFSHQALSKYPGVRAAHRHGGQEPRTLWGWIRKTRALFITSACRHVLRRKGARSLTSVVCVWSIFYATLFASHKDHTL